MANRRPKTPQRNVTAPGSHETRARTARRLSSGIDEAQGATEDRVGDRTGPAAGYDEEPVKAGKRGGVAES